jgi:hypothetical protein
LVQTLIAGTLSIGVFFILSDILKIPLIRTSKAVSNLSKRQKAKTSTIDLWIKDLSIFISKKIKINEYKRMQLLSDLQTANINITPELHISNAMIKSGVCLLLAFPALFIFPLILPLIIALAIAVYFNTSNGINLKIKTKRQAIEFELPHLVFTIEKTLLHSRDILSILDTYRENAGPELKQELSITVADMRSGNYESAIKRLDSRVGSAMLSDITRGLRSMLHGDDTAVYWATLSIKFADIQRQQLKQHALKVPPKVKRLSTALLFSFMSVYLVVIIMEIISSLGALF